MTGALGVRVALGRGATLRSSVGTPDVVMGDKEADVRLVERVAAGDAEALGTLYDTYGRVVFGIGYRMLGSAEAAEEVAQDAFQAVWGQARSYRIERGSVRTWLLAIARNAAIDWRRTRGKRSEREWQLDAAEGLVAEVRVEERVIASLRDERVRAAVRALPAEQRDVLALAFWGGLSQTEIAARTGAPLGTVKSRVRLGMERLRQRLGEGDGL